MSASSPLPSGVVQGGTDWGDSAPSGGDPGERFAFTCPPGGRPNAVWGTDIYTSDSSVCTAAVHAGLIDFVNGGSVVIEIRTGLPSYEGSERNGVTTSAYGSWSSSFAFVGGQAQASPSVGPSPSAGPGGSAYEDLLEHILPVIRTTCEEIDPTAAGALAVANCQPEDRIIDPVVVVGDVVYIQHADLARATANYSEKLAEIGDQYGEDCRVGPSQVAYEVDGEIHGRLLCAADTKYGGEVIAWWYDDRFNIVGSVLLFEGSYDDLMNIVELAAVQP